MSSAVPKRLTPVAAESVFGTDISAATSHVMNRPLISFRMPEPRFITVLIESGHPVLGFILALAWIVVPSTIALLAVMRVTHGL